MAKPPCKIERATCRWCLLLQDRRFARLFIAMRSPALAQVDMVPKAIMHILVNPVSTCASGVSERADEVRLRCVGCRDVGRTAG